MNLPPTPMLVMVLAFCKGDKYGNGDHPHLLALPDDQDPYSVTLWHATVHPDETPLQAAVRSIWPAVSPVHPRAHHLMEPQNLLPAGDSLSDSHRIHLFYLPWLVPVELLERNLVAFMDVEDSDMLARLNENSRAAIKAAPPPVKRRLEPFDCSNAPALFA